MKKVLTLIVSVVLIASLCLAFTACDKEEASTKITVPEGTKTITLIGDSICEALLGPVPISERDNYGYYALLGKMNGWKYYNHSVSGNKTSGSMIKGGFGLLELLNRTDEEETATLIKTHLIEADVIHISILGNNALQYNLGLMLAELQDPDWYKSTTWYTDSFNDLTGKGSKTVTHPILGTEVTNTYAEVNVNIFDALVNGKTVLRPSITYNSDNEIVYGAYTEVYDFPETLNDVGEIIDTLRKLNPDAEIYFQKVYNPVYTGTSLISPAIYEVLAQGGVNSDADKIDTTAKLRVAADGILSHLNGVLDTYLEDHPGAFTIIDTQAAYEEVTQLDKVDNVTNLEGDSLGRSIIYPDWVHPSNLGHAIIADITQTQLVKDGLVSEAENAKALEYYKNLKVDQINRLYKGVAGFDDAKAIAAVNSGTTMREVTLKYFAATKGFTPKA